MHAERFWYVRELIAAGPGNGCQPMFFAAAVIFSMNAVPRSGGMLLSGRPLRMMYRNPG